MADLYKYILAVHTSLEFYRIFRNVIIMQQVL